MEFEGEIRFDFSYLSKYNYREGAIKLSTAWKSIVRLLLSTTWSLYTY